MKFPVDAPKRKVIKAFELRTICTQTGISRENFLDAYYK